MRGSASRARRSLSFVQFGWCAVLHFATALPRGPQARWRCVPCANGRTFLYIIRCASCCSCQTAPWRGASGGCDASGAAFEPVDGDGGGGDVQNAFELYYHALGAGAPHLDQRADGAHEGASDDAHALAGLQVVVVGVDVADVFFHLAGHADEVLHVVVAHGERRRKVAVVLHDVAQIGQRRVFQMVEHGFLRADKHEVAHGRHELPLFFMVSDDIFVAHRNERGDGKQAESVVGLKLTAVGDAQCEPFRCFLRVLLDFQS